MLGCLYYFLIYQPENSSHQRISTLEKTETISRQNQTRQENQKPAAQKNETVMVDVKGEVKTPGVYQSRQTERVIDVIRRAGGLTDQADKTQVNFAAHIQDEMVIYIPAKGESNRSVPAENAAETVAHAHTGTISGKKININQADESELENLPGIGPSKAAAIVDYRKQNGSFQTIDDLKKISGIGDKSFEKLKESISVQ